MAYDSENKDLELEEETLEDKFRKAGNWLNKNLSGIFAVLISAFFIFQGVVKILPTELGIKEQIIMAFTNIVAGFSITSLVGEYGFTSAKNSEKYEKHIERYNQSVNSALQYREAIEELAKERANENLKNARIHILENVNLWYKDVFNEDGSLNKDFDIMKYKKEQGFSKKLRAYHKAVRMKVVSTNVFGMASSSLFGIKKEVTEKEYRTKKGLKSLIIKVLLGVFSVGIMFTFIGWSWGAIIYAFMQIVLWVGFGLIERQKNYNFVIEEILPQINSRRIIIDEFLAKSEEDKLIYINKANEKHKKVLALPYIEKPLQSDNS